MAHKIANEISSCLLTGSGRRRPGMTRRARAPAGQGFGQAAEDAHALATAVREHGPVPEALRAFESMRWERVSRIGEIEQVCWYPGLPSYSFRHEL